MLGVLCGLAPFFLAPIIGWPLGVLGAAIALSYLLLRAVSQDRQNRGLATLGLAFLSHSVMAILLIYQAPQVLDDYFPAGHAYWEKSRQWILTGVNAEYDTAHWLPVHGVLFVLVASSAYVTFGVVTFYLGFLQVDLMNAYVAHLLAKSESPWLALGVGWHPWSVLRGLGYLLLTYEAASLSLSHLSATKLSTPTRRRWRWFFALFFLACDALVKYLTLEPCRQTLLSNWRE